MSNGDKAVLFFTILVFVAGLVVGAHFADRNARTEAAQIGFQVGKTVYKCEPQ